MDPLRGCLALGPLGLYLLTLAVLNLRPRPTLISGPRDTAALVIGLAGLVLVGPIELLLPQRALTVFAIGAWLAALACYGLAACLVVLFARRRLVIYNLPPSVGRPVVLDVIAGLDPHSRQAGSTMVSPRLEIELRIDEAPWLCNLSLVSQRGDDDPAGWQRLEAALAARVRELKVGPNFCGTWLLTASMAMLAWVGWQVVTQPEAIQRSFWEMLRIYE
jgi:hypothetical protein